jgi:hypothetical protein
MEPITPLSKKAKWLAAVLLVGLTTATIVLIIAFWPDRLPDLNKNDTSVYQCKLFNMKLLDTTQFWKIYGEEITTEPKSAIKVDTSTKNADSLAKDTLPKIDTNKNKKSTAVPSKLNTDPDECCKLINLNTLLLILVALMGFLGNMIHVSTSFTTFVGNDSFKRSWLLWYCVKPFTAAGFAVVLYFVLRGGFLSYNSGVANFNIYGILAMAALAGLFTDTATLKLKEVFDVIFKPKDDRGDKLSDTKPFKVDKVSPQPLNKDAVNNIVLTGSGLNKQGLTITVGSTTISNYVKTDTSITFSYTASDADKANPTVVLNIIEASANIYTATLPLA